MKNSRIFLSPPHLGDQELSLVKEAFASNYIAPLGPMVEAFEEEFAAVVGIPHCVALGSGTAAMHLALRHLRDGAMASGRLDQNHRPVVLGSTLTFIGSVSPATFLNCPLHFIDSDRQTWNLDPALLEEELAWCRQNKQPVLAVIPTDLYGQCCNVPVLAGICRSYNVPLIIDSAESLGATYRDAGGAPRHAGQGGRCAIYSFNGNKIITTSGGGLLASEDAELIKHARNLSQQARAETPWYEHVEIGYNYRMSNILAAIGRGQLRLLPQRVARKRQIFAAYQEMLGALPGISFMPEADYGQSNRWLTVITVNPRQAGVDSDHLRRKLEEHNIESRPLWKPMHRQPVFQHCRVRGGQVSDELFATGLCLPSGTAMSNTDVERVSAIIAAEINRGPRNIRKETGAQKQNH